MTARLKSDGNGSVCEVFRRLDLGFGRHHDAARKHRICARPQSAMSSGSGHVNGPVTSRTDVARTTLLNSLICAFDLILRQLRGGFDAHLRKTSGIDEL